MQDIDDQNLPVNLLGAGGAHQPCRFLFSFQSSVLSAFDLLIIIATDSVLSDCSLVVFTVSAKARPFLLPDDAAS
jgi:hypothetical protein